MKTATISIGSKFGLHLRVASEVAQKATEYVSDIKVINNGRTADGRSIIELVLLNAGPGSELTISAAGSDENEAIHDLIDVFGHGEGI
jgi:phosphocarrier protein HPr